MINRRRLPLPVVHNFTVHTEIDNTILFPKVVDPSTLLSLDLTHYYVKLQARRTSGDPTILANLEHDNLSARVDNDGDVQVTFPASILCAMRDLTYYDLFLVDLVSGRHFKAFQGIIYIEDSITTLGNTAGIPTEFPSCACTTAPHSGFTEQESKPAVAGELTYALSKIPSGIVVTFFNGSIVETSLTEPNLITITSLASSQVLGSETIIFIY